MSIASETINKLFFMVVVSCMFCACSNKAQEFDLQCQSGWEAQFPLSNTIYNKLSEHQYTRYLSIKEGNDRGTYRFYFLGQTDHFGLFLHANQNEMITGATSLAEVDEAFSFLPKDIQTLKGYTGSGDIWVHLSCDYMKINTSKYTKILSFHDYILMHSQTESASRQGVETLLKIKNYFNHWLKSAQTRLDKLTIIKVDTIASLNQEIITTIKARKTNHFLFYEIP